MYFFYSKLNFNLLLIYPDLNWGIINKNKKAVDFRQPLFYKLLFY